MRYSPNLNYSSFCKLFVKTTLHSGSTSRKYTSKLLNITVDKSGMGKCETFVKYYYRVDWMNELEISAAAFLIVNSICLLLRKKRAKTKKIVDCSV